MIRSNTIIGAYQQMKQKFVYDTKAQVLGFGLEDCEKNGWSRLSFSMFHIRIVITIYSYRSKNLI
jgi:hypothetical protein